MKAIALVQTKDKDLNQLQQNISQSVNPLISNPITQGNYVMNQSLAIGPNTINHGLGYGMTGYSVISTNAASQFSDNLIAVPNPQKSFILTSSAVCQVNLYCF